MQKALKIIAAILISILLLLYILWLLLINYLVPFVFAPEAVKQINESFRGNALLKVGGTRFDFRKGFSFSDATLSVKHGSGYKRLFTAGSIKMSIDMNKLFSGKVDINEIAVSGAELDIGRDSKGVWNFAPLFEAAPKDRTRAATSEIRFESVDLSDCVIHFWDDLQKRNSMDRRFVNARAAMEVLEGNRYFVKMSASDKDPDVEAVELKFIYDSGHKVFEGKTKLNTKYLGKYWDYYLDDLFDPWHLKVKDLKAEAAFIYSKDILDLEGSYILDGCAVKYGTIEGTSGNVRVDQKLRVVKGKVSKNKSTFKVDLSDVSVPLLDDVYKLDRLFCDATVTDRQVLLNLVKGCYEGRHFHLSGRYTFNYPKNLYLQGKLRGLYAIFGLRILSRNTAEAEFKGKTWGAEFDMHANIPDIKNLLVDLKAKALVSLPMSSETIKASVKLGDHEIRVWLDFSCGINGYLRKADTINGGAHLKVTYVSDLSEYPGYFVSKMSVVDGVFEGTIPRTPFYKGYISGLAKTGMKEWGMELRIDSLDLDDLSRISKEYRNMKGIFNGNVACAADWSDWRTLRGGGYVNLKKANLQDVPIFKTAATGVEGLKAGVEIPPIEKVVGNFEIKDQQVNLQNMYCMAYQLSLNLTGNIKFTGETNVTAGVKFIAGFWKTLRQILLPFTIPFDMAASSVRINISGVWPDLKQTTSIQSMEWLSEFNNKKENPDPDKYKLKDLWSD